MDRLKEFADNLGNLHNKKIPAIHTNNEQDCYDQNKITLKFLSPHVEKSFKDDFIEMHLGVMLWVIRIIGVGLLFWLILELATESISFAFILVRIIVILVWGILVIYTCTQHYKEHYVRVTVTISYLIVIFKFLIEIWFLKEGGMASAMIPLITFLLFNVDWILISYVNALSVVLSLFSLTVHNASENRDSDVVAIIGIYYFLFLVAITLVSGFVGYWIERAERKEFKLI